MISLNTLTAKPPAVNQFNENIIDLTAPSFSYKRDVKIIAAGLVSDELEMRPDLAAKIYYGDISKLDYILKFNGISNPFSLQSGTVLLIGDLDEMKHNFASEANVNPETNQKDIREKFFDKNRLSKKDAKRLALVQQKSSQFANGASNLTPNMAEIGSVEIKVQNGVVIFGADVVANKDNCPETLSRAVVKAKLLEKKIFKNP
jgi:hypothetical protein